MKIAQVCHRYYPHIGGVETHVQEISERLVKKGHEVEVLTTDPSARLPKDEVINGVRVRRFGSWAPSEAYYFSRDLQKYLTRNSGIYDLSHAHSYHSFPSLYAANAKNEKKLIVTPHYHGTSHTTFRAILFRFYKLVGRRIFEKADRVICVSNYEKNLLLKHFRIFEEKTTVIPNGINLSEFRNLKRTEKDHKTILYVGRLEEYKGVQYLVRALPRLGEDTELEVVGKGQFKTAIVRLVRKLGVENRVKLSEDIPRNELLQKYADADLFVLLSRHEAFAICVAEALASGTPCIVANTSALTEWIDDKSCFGVDYPVKVDSLAELIKNVIGTEVHQPRLWDWEEVVNKVAEVYDDVGEI